MKYRSILMFAVTFSLTQSALVSAQTSRPISETAVARVATASSDPTDPKGDKGKKGSVAPAPQPDKAPGTEPVSADPLVRVLVTKGVLSADEARAVGSAGTASEQRDRLATLLRSKGVISDSEFEAIRSVPSGAAAGETATAEPQNTQNPRAEGPGTINAPTTGPYLSFIPGIAPIRVLGIDPPKREGLIPDIKLGSGARVKLYGFFKTSIVHDSSSPAGNDFPLPLLAADTGPDTSPEFHLKARAFRFGANFEWIDPAPKTTITGRLEFDFEGNFSRANNRNISSIRSSMPSIRLAWARIDRRLNENTTAYVLFGQDWTPFGSSTLPNLIETTGLGLGYGTLYTRAPQARVGFNFKTKGPRGLQFQPEFAIVLPAFGDLPADVANQLGFGERQGADSETPAVEGRFVTQWQLDKARGVAPAQFIVSWEHQRRRVIVTAAGVPAGFKRFFPSGAQLDSTSNGGDAELQIPTRFVTVLAKYYRGTDLRWFFSGQLISNFNDAAGFTGTQTGTSIDAGSSPIFGFLNGVASVAPERPVRSQGGFLNLGFPLSRIFGADPKGRNAGWTMYMHYGFDSVNPRDGRRFNPLRGKSDLFAGNLQYRLNSFITLAYEQSYYRTRMPNNSNADSAVGLPLLRGIPSRTAHDVRTEFATIFNF